MTPTFSATEQTLIDEAVRTTGRIVRQSWIQPYRLRAMQREVDRRRALMPEPEKPTRDKVHYHADRRIKWRGNHAIHEADAGLPICRYRFKGFDEPKWAHEIEHLGPGPVTCGHCANTQGR